MGSNVTDTGVVVVGDVKKIGIGIFVYKQRLLSIQKVVQHVQTFRIFFTTQAPGPVTGEFIELVPSLKLLKVLKVSYHVSLKITLILNENR